MLRLLAVAAWLAALTFFGLYLNLLGKGPFAGLEASHRREMKDRSASPSRVEPISMAGFLALPKGLPVAEYSAFERRAVSLEGHVQAIFRASDGDYHVSLVPSGGTPAQSITTEITPQWHHDGAGGWNYERLVALLRPDAGGLTEWPGGPARVRISGWLLLDDESHWLPKILGFQPEPPATDWEIHPITKIELWDDGATDWVEVKP